jgi:hypothetical protein
LRDVAAEVARLVVLDARGRDLRLEGAVPDCGAEALKPGSASQSLSVGLGVVRHSNDPCTC